MIVIEHNELDLLRGFDADGHLALSLYLDVSTPERRSGVLQRVLTELEPLFAEANEADGERLLALQEDLEMIRLYFKASGSHRSSYMAIFSCAPQLFWRAYRLDTPVRELVDVGPRFSLAPLAEALAGPDEMRELLIGQRDLRLHSKYASL